MTVTLDIKPETERRLRRKAEQEGQDFPQYLEALLDENAEAADETEEAEGSAYDLFAGRIGRIQGSGEAFSQNCGERFTQYVVEKHKAGDL
jgi:hypothetical protein